MSSQTVTQHGEEWTGKGEASQQRGNPGLVKRIHREVRFGSYILGSTLGEGEFGKVKLGWRKDGKQPSQVAIKLIKRDTIMKDSESEIKIHREINSLKMLNHPNIVNLVEVMKSGKYIGIVLEYASGGELFDYILQHKYLKENVAKKLFAQLVSGVDYMHSKGLIHRDLKLENLLLDKHKNVIISDFGFVNSYHREKNDLMKTSCGSPCYAAPELVLTQAPYEGRKVDIWSLGVILYAMLSGYLPFDDDPENEDGSDIVRLYNYICKTPLTFPEYVSPLARDLLRKIIVPDPRKRIDINVIRNHPWLSSYASLLSIRQDEWDRVHKESRETTTLADAKSKRFSMVLEKTNSSSLMMSNPSSNNSRSYSTTTMGHLYSHPSTSSSLANAVAIPKSTSPTIPQSNGSSPSPTRVTAGRGHSKSASTSNTYATASNVLKSMVNDVNGTSENSLNSLNQPLFPPPPSKSTYNFSGSPVPHAQRVPTYVGTAISTINESASPQTTSEVTEISNLHLNSMNNSIIKPPKSNANSSASSRDSNRLPHSNKKPRPTSYHPSSMSSSLVSPNIQNPNNLYEYMKIGGSPMNIPITQLLSSSPTKSVTSDRSNDGSSVSPTNKSTISVGSRRDSVVTHVNVNGVLSSESNLTSHDNKRNSVLSYLEDKIDVFDLNESSSKKSSSNPNSSSTTPKTSQIPIFESLTAAPSAGKNNVESLGSEQTLKPTLEAPKDDQSSAKRHSKAYPSKEAAVSDPKDSTASEFNEDGKFTSNIDNTEKFPSEMTKNGNSKKNTSRTRKTSKIERERSRSDKDPPSRDGNKENRDTKRRNRFSILSFYSTYNSSSSNISSLNGTGRRVLEPSSDVNVQMPSQGYLKEQRRLDSSGSSKSTQSKKSGVSNSTSYSGKEASAAKKVMDFFKRRSIRIG